ncbi:MAG: hypothetical protein B7Z77_04220 [Acidocella sp. 20-58-15]|nr:MAG: hypothetical protein B7Z77_04220 [Acidocella sp. 20-58-15]
MFDVNRKATPEEAGRIASDPLLHACEEFWVLQSSKESLISEEDALTLSYNSSEKLLSVQGQLLATLYRIRSSPVKNREGFNEKLRVLKYRARATDYQDTDIFRELVMLLDEREAEVGELGSSGMRKSGRGSKEKRIRRLHLHNLFGIFNN